MIGGALSGDGAIYISTIIAVVVVVGMFLTYKSQKNDPKTHRTRLGVFIERERFQDETEEEKEKETK